MGRKEQIGPDMSIDEIMRIWPETISVVIRHRLKCIGCPLATFHTAIDAATEHEMDMDKLIDDLNRAIREKE